MGLFDVIRNELIDIIEWVDDSRHTLVWRFPRYQNEIKNGAQLIVRPGQIAAFVNQGEIADVFEPGQYTLESKNLPVLSTLQGWKYGFDSPFKCEVYFVATRQVTDLKWGTPNPVIMRDPDFGPVRIRAFGNYTLRAVDPRALLTELVATDSSFEADEISELLRAIVVQSFSDACASSKIAVLDLASSYAELAEQVRQTVVERVDDEYGLDIPQLQVVNISLPPEVEKALDARSSMNVIGNLQQYQAYQMGNAIPIAAENPAGGLAGAGVGLGMGMAMASQMMPGMAGQPPAAGTATPPPPPPPPAAAWHVTQNGQTAGPFNLQGLAQAAAAGQLLPATLVWSAGMAAWTPASQVPELAALFAAQPPPPPPPPPAAPVEPPARARGGSHGPAPRTMTTLIAGGCGFIGLNVAEAWLTAGRPVVLLDRNPPPPEAVAAFAGLPASWVHAPVDVTDAGAVSDLFHRHDIEQVVYGAAVTSGPERERRHPEQVIAVNLLGLTHVIKAAAEHGIGRLINLSSGSAYGDGGLDRCGATAPLDEGASRALPSTVYGVTKLASEGICRRMAGLTGLDLRSVRLSTIFGPWELVSGARDTLSAPMQAAIHALRGEAALLPRRDSRDWTYSRDVARALMALMDAPDPRHDLYHVSAGRTCSVLDWGEALGAHFPGFTCRLAGQGEKANVDLHADDRLPMSPERLASDVGHRVPGDVAATAADFAGWMKRYPDYWFGGGT